MSFRMSDNLRICFMAFFAGKLQQNGDEKTIATILLERSISGLLLHNAAS